MSRSKQSKPERTCRACRTKQAKADLTRWVLVGDEATKDPKQNLPGRAVYTCSDGCYDKIQKQLPYLLKASRAK